MTKESNAPTQLAKPSHSRPPYLIALVGITLAYLLLECAFNARLLDVAGGQSDSHAIEKVEFWGRIISGLAVALAACGTVLLPWLHRRGAGWKELLGISVLVGLPIVAGVFHAEKWLIDTLVQQSTAHERRVAALLSVASHQLRKGEVNVQGMDLTPEVLASPEGKAFVALFSPLVVHLPDAEAIILRELDSLVRQSVRQSMGDADHAYFRAFDKSLQAWSETYEEFASKVVMPYRAKLHAIPADSEKTWRDYVSELKGNRTTPSSVPQRYHAKVRRSVQTKGIPVPDTWHPSDKATFMRVFQAETKKRLIERAHAEVSRSDPRMAPLPLEGFHDFDTFLLHPTVQKQWREALQAPVGVILKNGMSMHEFVQQTYTPWYEYQVALQKQTLLAASAAYGDGGKHESLGREAIRGIIVPPLALLFSLLGIIVHVSKAGFYTLRLFWLGTLPAVGINALLFCILMTIPLYLPNAITGTTVFTNVESRVTSNHPYKVKALRWILQGQAYAYPFNTWIRTHVFWDTTFNGQRENIL